jgi:predicted ATP-grasp superfamily ATP-dependent carboligase
MQQRRHGVAETPEEFRRLVHELSGPDHALPVIQAFVPGRACAVSAVVHEGEVLTYIARETLSFEPVSGGTSVWKRTIPPDSPGVRDSLELLVALGYEGLAEVEYQLDAGGPRFMEIGSRVHGWVPLAVAAGIDLPLIAAKAAMGEPTPAPPVYEVGAEMRWLRGEVARLRVALSRRPHLPPGISRRRILANAFPPWRPGMHYDGFDLSDPGPWLPKAFAELRRRARSSTQHEHER